MYKSSRTKRLDMLAMNGLGTALKEQRLIRECKNDHSRYMKSGYAFCPQCGQKLEIVRNCPTCDRAFLSNKSFAFHILVQKHKASCPSCGGPAGAFTRNVTKGRLKFYCPQCEAYIECSEELDSVTFRDKERVIDFDRLSLRKPNG